MSVRKAFPAFPVALALALYGAARQPAVPERPPLQTPEPPASHAPFPPHREVAILAEKWAPLIAHDLTDRKCLELGWPFYGQYAGPASFRIEEGLRIAGAHTASSFWWKQHAGDSYLLSTDVRMGKLGAYLWLGGAGYGASYRMGYVLSLRGDFRSVWLLRDHRLVAEFECPFELPDKGWFRLHALRNRGSFAIYVNAEKLGEWRDPKPLVGPLHSFVAIGSHREGVVYRAFCLRVPESRVRPLTRAPLARVLDPPKGRRPARNGPLLFEQNFADSDLSDWALAEPHNVTQTADGIRLSGPNGKPRLWLRQPLSRDFAVECTMRYPEGRGPINLSLRLGLGAPSDVDKDRYAGWYAPFPDGRGEAKICWKPSDKDPIELAATPYFAPINERDYVVRLEKRGDGLRLFSNGRFLLEAKTDEDVPDNAPIFLGFGQYYGASLIESVKAWRL